MYATDFTPEGGISRETWVAQRRDRISTPKKISVRVIDPKTSDIEDGAVRVSFSHAYESDSFSDTVNKVIELVPVNGICKIVREYTRCAHPTVLASILFLQAMGTSYYLVSSSSVRICPTP